MKDISNERLIHLKGALFLVLGAIASALLLYTHRADRAAARSARSAASTTTPST
jgi:hypothetical protein